MKKFGISILLTAVLLGMGLNSCDKDGFTEEDAMNLQAQLDKQKQLDQDSLHTKNYRVTYTINLVDASISTLKSGSAVNALSGAQVKFVQDTTIIIQPADASGIVTFSNLKPGNANINITLDGYSQVNYTVNLSSNYADGGRQASNIIPLIPISGTATGTIKGKVTYEADLTNLTPEIVPEGTKVLAMVSRNSDALPSLNSGNITAISYDNLSLSATTNANGEFTMTVPATVLGLDYEIIVNDFTVNQKLLQNTYLTRDTSGVLTIPASFGSSFQSPSDVNSGTPVIVTIAAPDYTTTPANTATATAVVDNPNGIQYIQNTNVGSYYYDGNYFYASIDNPSSDPAATDASFYFLASNGHISEIGMNGYGSKFPLTQQGVTLTIPYILEPAKAIVDAVNASGAITQYHVVPSKTGRFYSIKNIQLSKHTGNGTGVVTNFPYIYSGSYLYFATGGKSLNPAVGSGYAVGDSMILTVNSTMNDEYKGKLHMTTGSVTAINLTNEGANYISGQVDVIIDSPVNGTTATATASVVNGKISRITLNSYGSGYSSTSLPKVNIINKAERTQAKYEAVLNNEGQIWYFEALNQGNGYVSVPSVTITSAIPGAGTGASAYATVSGGRVTSLTLINKGNGYRGNTPYYEKYYNGTSDITVKGSSTSIVNIDLGTGRRTVVQ